jgi:hypothetical protein
MKMYDGLGECQVFKAKAKANGAKRSFVGREGKKLTEPGEPALDRSGERKYLCCGIRE